MSRDKIFITCAESLHHKNLPKTFGQSILSPPSAEEIKYNIQQCEIMKIEAINEANQALSSAGEEGLGSSAPRLVYQLEVCRKYICRHCHCIIFFPLQIGLGAAQLLTAVVCVVLCCRACCCSGPQQVILTSDWSPVHNTDL